MPTSSLAAPYLQSYTVTVRNGGDDVRYTLMAESSQIATDTILKTRPDAVVQQVRADALQPFAIVGTDRKPRTVLAANLAHACKLYAHDHPQTLPIASIEPTTATPLDEIARLLDPDAARRALAYVLAKLGGEDSTADDLAADLCETLACTVPEGLPSIATTNADDTTFWTNTRY